MSWLYELPEMLGAAGLDIPEMPMRPEIPMRPEHDVQHGRFRYSDPEPTPWLGGPYSPLPPESISPNEVLAVSGYHLEGAERLRQIYFPQLDTADISRHQELYHHSGFITAHLEGFGIPYDPAATVADLVGLMRESLDNGLFDPTLPSPTAIWAPLREELATRRAAYNTAIEAYVIDTIAYEEKVMNLVRECFINKSTLREKFIFSPEFFIRTYYLDDDGQPDRTKLPDVMVFEDVERIRWMAQPVPGLFALHEYWERDADTHGDEAYLGTFVLGWNADEVLRIMDGVRVKAEEEQDRVMRRRERVLSRKQEERYEEHLQFVASQAGVEPSISGRYLVRCPVIEEATLTHRREELGEGQYLTIKPCSASQEGRPTKVFSAFADLGRFQGSLVLCADRDVLAQWITEEQARVSGDDDEDGSEDSVIGLEPERGIEDGLRLSGKGKTGENTVERTLPKGEQSLPLVYHCKWYLNSFAEDLPLGYGKIVFQDTTFTRFGAELGLPYSPFKSLLGGGKISNSTDHGNEVAWGEGGHGGWMPS